MAHQQIFDYELLDCGDFRRIERFGKLTIDRPCPQAFWAPEAQPISSNIFFDRNQNQGQWNGTEKLPETWPIKIDHITAELKFSPNGQVGIFPEQLDNWRWINEKINEQPERQLKILNTFAYTGMSTLFASAPHTQVCHVDGAKAAVNWAKRNAELSGLAGNNIRWMVDDAKQFMQREIRRGNKYDAIILDPPAFGRGAKKDWKIERDLRGLMKTVGELLTDKPLFVILTCHAPDHFAPRDLAKILESIPQFKNQKAEKLLLEIPSTKGNALLSSFGARIHI